MLHNDPRAARTSATAWSDRSRRTSASSGAPFAEGQIGAEDSFSSASAREEQFRPADLDAGDSFAQLGAAARDHARAAGDHHDAVEDHAGEDHAGDSFAQLGSVLGFGPEFGRAVREARAAQKKHENNSALQKQHQKGKGGTNESAQRERRPVVELDGVPSGLRTGTSARPVGDPDPAWEDTLLLSSSSAGPRGTARSSAGEARSGGETSGEARSGGETGTGERRAAPAGVVVASAPAGEAAGTRSAGEQAAIEFEGAGGSSVHVRGANDDEEGERRSAARGLDPGSGGVRGWTEVQGREVEVDGRGVDSSSRERGASASGAASAEAMLSQEEI